MPPDTTAALIPRLAAALRQRGLMLVSAESCTGGLIAAACTSAPGSSQWFDRAFVTYSNAAKVSMLGVNPADIERHGAVSQSVARQMAEGAAAHATQPTSAPAPSHSASPVPAPITRLTPPGHCTTPSHPSAGAAAQPASPSALTHTAPSHTPAWQHPHGPNTVQPSTSTPAPNGPPVPATSRIVSVAVTGIAGPDGASADKPVGTVWFAWHIPSPAPGPQSSPSALNPPSPTPLPGAQGIHPSSAPSPSAATAPGPQCAHALLTHPPGLPGLGGRTHSQRMCFDGDRASVRQQTVQHALRTLLQLLDNPAHTHPPGDSAP